MTLHAPQIIMLSMLMLSLGIGLAQHGEPKKGNHNFTIDVLAVGITFGLLYWGGFFG